MENPNEYDDDRYTQASVETVDAISEMWMAGAKLEDIENDIENGIENAGGPKVSVSIVERKP